MSDIKTLKSAEITLENEEMQCVCHCINQYGSGDHPWAGKETVMMFDSEYAAECIKKYLPNASSDHHTEVANSVLTKLEGK